MKAFGRMPLALGLALAVSGAAQAAVYSCVNDKGERFISDKACPPNQSTQKVYKAPSAPATRSDAAALPEGMPEGATPAEQEALMRARLMQRIGERMDREDQERAAQEKADAEYRRKHENQRQMESYLQQKQQ